MVTVAIDKVEVYYRAVVDTDKGRKIYRVRDDGWALQVKTPDGNSVGRISFGTDSKRKPDRDSALTELRKWAVQDMSAV